MLDLYLIEAWPTRGNSGGSVFFRPNIQREPGTFIIDKPKLLLAGILKGFLGVPMQAHAGIGAVVPAFKLGEILSNDNAMHLEQLSELALAKTRTFSYVGKRKVFSGNAKSFSLKVRRFIKSGNTRLRTH